MNDMSRVIVPKSEQLNSDDMISGPLSIRITSVDIRAGQDQPVSIHYEGDGGKPYKPCKSMCRIMVAAWGPDARLYAGRSMTLYRDPTVKWGGMEVGGIRISHMSDIDRAMVLALTATKGSRKPYTVKPIEASALSHQKDNAPATAAQPKPPRDIPAELIMRIGQFAAPDELRAWWLSERVSNAVNGLPPEDADRVQTAYDTKYEMISRIEP
jgi:hypothetical protein